jgi:RNA-directed DNA polymerase
VGIAALEDKSVPQAVVTLLTQMDAEDVRGFSSGVRPGRSPHQALDALAVALTRKPVNDVLDGDMRGVFDTLAHACCVKGLPPRVADPRVLRLLQTWLRAGGSDNRGYLLQRRNGSPGVGNRFFRVYMSNTSNIF